MFQTLRLLACLLIACLLSTSVWAGSVSLTLVDAQTQAALPDFRVDAYLTLADGSSQWKAKAYTGPGGQVEFTLPDLNTQESYLFKTKVFNNYRTSLSIRKSTTQEYWPVGSFTATLVDGTQPQKPPLVNSSISVQVQKEDGKFTWYTGITTDERGIIRMDLPNLGTGSIYRLYAKSPLNGQTKYSDLITGLQPFHFVVGNLPLRVRLVDAEKNQPLTDIQVTAYEKLADGTQKWSSRVTTDELGQALFDLDGLGAGRNYFLKAQVYNQFTAYSGLFTAPAESNWLIGDVRVNVFNGSTSPMAALAGYEVAIEQLNEEGKFGWYSKAFTDEEGHLNLNLPFTAQGQSFRLKAKSPVDGIYRYGPMIQQAGSYEFVVGNPALTARVINALSGQAIAGLDVTVYRQNAEGSPTWITRRTTDNLGKVTFDLEGINGGTEYFLKAQPYNGGTTYSPTIRSYGSMDFAVGAVPITLFDKVTQSPFVGQKVTVYRAMDDGSLQWVKQALTDSTGLIRFDLEGLRNGERYLLKTSNPFGENKTYYSGVIVAEGPFAFGITRGETAKPDVVFPTLAISSPGEGQIVSSRGFLVNGTASDNQRISRISALVQSPGLPEVVLEGEYISTTGLWQITVLPSQLTPDAPVTLTISAADGSNNITRLSAHYQVSPQVTDNAAPVLSLVSHQDGDAVPKTGVILTGQVTDDVGVISLLATVTDGTLGKVIEGQPIPFSSQTGKWELVLRNGQLTAGQSVQIELTAADEAGHAAHLTARFTVTPVAHEVEQMLGRLTFGSTPALREHIRAIGPEAFLQEQLNPTTIDNSVFDLFIANAQPQSLSDLRFWALQHMLFSERQLQEVMTQFWENHFNTQFQAHNKVNYEIAENRGFRQHALGRFRDLLEVSAKSPAMIFYLNNAENVRGAPNENYARELLELHTVGVDGGYTSADIAELAKVFTGWHVRNDQFFFNSAEHDYDSKTILGSPINGTGLSEGEMMLDKLAMHPATVSRICGKMAALLVSESPNASTLSACVNAWQSSGGLIGSAVEALIRSPEFSADSNFRSKIKTPLELLGSVIRNFSANFSQSAMDTALRNMGMSLFDFPVPTGNSEDSVDWINSNLILQRNRFVNQVAFNFNRSSNNYIDVVNLVREANLNSAEAIVVFFFDLALGGDYSDGDYQTGLAILLNGSPSFDLEEPEAEILLRRLLGHVMSFPGYQFQ